MCGSLPSASVWQMPIVHSKKRKRRAGKSGNKAAKQPKPDMGVVYVQGYELQQACNFKREDAHRGQVSSAETA